MNELDQSTRLAVGNFQIQSQLAGASGQGMSISGYIYSDDGEDALNNRLDLFKRVIDRQQKISEIPLLEAKVTGLREALKQHEKMHHEFLEKQKQNIKMPSAEKLQAKNLEVNMKHFVEQIEQGEQTIHRMRVEVG